MAGGPILFPSNALNRSEYDAANTVLVAATANSPFSTVMGASTVLARLAAGDTKACSVAEMQALLGITPEHYADFTGEQAILADATIRTWVAPGPGNIVSVYARVATQHAGAGDAEHSDIEVNKNSASILTGAIALTHAIGTTAVAGVLSVAPGVVDFVAGDVFTIVEDYTLDGGGGDTGANLAVVVEYLLD
jgi:hypothetical protein